MIRKKRKLTDEQRAAAAERLKKARENRKPSKNLSVHPDIRDMDINHPLHPTNVKKWLKANKEIKVELKKQLKVKYDRVINDKYNRVDCYIQNMEQYLRTGIWLDLFYGEQQEKKMYPIGYTRVRS